MNDWDRVILHVDMNAFFASVEQQCNPELRGQPIAVIGTGRTVVTTASYEARKFGVKTGMNTWQARQACPQLIFVVGDNRKYADTSTKIVAMMRQYTPLVEVFSIDEAFLDVTGSLSLFGSAETIAYRLKAQIRHELGLTCSIGIAPNKLLAKLASDMHKPDGLTIIRPERVAEILERLPVKELCGIGKKVEKQLADLNIFTCGQLGRTPVDRLKRRFGVSGERLVMMGRGIDDLPVIAPGDEDEVKSVGHSMTLVQDVSGREALAKYILQLAEMVGRRARRYHVTGKTVHLTIRYGDFTTLGKQQTRVAPTNSSEEIYRDAMAILETRDLGMQFGELKALSDITLAVEPGEILGLIGPNGAGKTTFFNCLTGFLTPTHGEVRFDGRSIAGFGPHRICRLGLCRTFQIVQSFAEMTVLENVMMGAFCRHAATRACTARAEEVLEITGLAGKRDQLAGEREPVAAHVRGVGARGVAPGERVLHLDDVGAQPAQQQRGVGSGQRGGEVDDPLSRQRPRRHASSLAPVMLGGEGFRKEQCPAHIDAQMFI